MANSTILPLFAARVLVELSGNIIYCFLGDFGVLLFCLGDYRVKVSLVDIRCEVWVCLTASWVVY